MSDLSSHGFSAKFSVLGMSSLLLAGPSAQLDDFCFTPKIEVVVFCQAHGYYGSQAYPLGGTVGYSSPVFQYSENKSFQLLSVPA